MNNPREIEQLRSKIADWITQHYTSKLCQTPGPTEEDPRQLEIHEGLSLFPLAPDTPGLTLDSSLLDSHNAALTRFDNVQIGSAQLVGELGQAAATLEALYALDVSVLPVLTAFNQYR